MGRYCHFILFHYQYSMVMGVVILQSTTPELESFWLLSILELMIRGKKPTNNLSQMDGIVHSNSKLLLLLWELLLNQWKCPYSLERL